MILVRDNEYHFTQRPGRISPQGPFQTLDDVVLNMRILMRERSSSLH